jgi:hypothetical protein
LPEQKISSASDNKKNKQVAIDSWQFGPADPSLDPKANKPFWAALAKAWDMTEKESRRRMCLNCEYFCVDPMMQAMMEIIPVTDYDASGGGRGSCDKFNFVCSALRVCQAHEGDD